MMKNEKKLKCECSRQRMKKWRYSAHPERELFWSDFIPWYKHVIKNFLVCPFTLLPIKILIFALSMSLRQRIAY